MSPEHHRTHMCHMKATKAGRLIDTLQLSHKNTTNPTITHADKVMNTISACAAALKGVAGGKTPKKLKDLQESVEIAGRTATNNLSALE